MFQLPVLFDAGTFAFNSLYGLYTWRPKRSMNTLSARRCCAQRVFAKHQNSKPSQSGSSYALNIRRRTRIVTGRWESSIKSHSSLSNRTSQRRYRNKLCWPRVHFSTNDRRLHDCLFMDHFSSHRINMPKNVRVRFSLEAPKINRNLSVVRRFILPAIVRFHFNIPSGWLLFPCRRRRCPEFVNIVQTHEKDGRVYNKIINYNHDSLH